MTTNTITPFRSKSRISQILAENHLSRSARGRYGFKSRGFFVSTNNDGLVVVGWETGTTHYNNEIKSRADIVNESLDSIAWRLRRNGFAVEVKHAEQGIFTYTDGYVVVLGKIVEPKPEPAPKPEPKPEPVSEVGVDRTLVRLPLSDATGYADREIVAAVEQGKPITVERYVSQTGWPGRSRIISGPFTWESERKAVSVALSNAGWGPLDPAFDDDAHHEQCLWCAEEVYNEPGAGLVCLAEGGTYDYCEVSRNHKHEVSA